jgi:hypothetical protein
MKAAGVPLTTWKKDGRMDRIIASEIDEPVGIIISAGSREEPAPRFSAYVWGPVPDEPEPVVSGGTRAA